MSEEEKNEKLIREVDEDIAAMEKEFAGRYEWNQFLKNWKKYKKLQGKK